MPNFITPNTRLFVKTFWEHCQLASVVVSHSHKARKSLCKLFIQLPNILMVQMVMFQNQKG